MALSVVENTRKRKPGNTFLLFIMAGILFGKLLGASGNSLEDFVSETFLTDDGQVRFEGRTINYRASPRNAGFPILYVGKAVDQASGITATVGETENFKHPEDASQKAVSKLLGVLRERGLVIDQVQKTLPESSPSKPVPLEPEPKVPEPQPTQRPIEDGHDSKSVSNSPSFEPGCERAQDKKENEEDFEEPHLELEQGPNQEPVPDNSCSNNEGEEADLADNQSSDELEEDQGFLANHAGTHS